MTMNITASIMAHPKRKQAAEDLQNDLWTYPFTDVWITYDEQNSEWHTGERAIRSGANKGDWHLVIQDDAVLTPYFYENIEAALRTIDTKTLVSLYTGQCRPLGERVKQAVDTAAAEQASWLKHYMLCWGVAILIPSDHIEPMLDFVNDDRYKDTPYDVRIGIFYQRNMLPIYYTNPSLVDHNDAIGSLLDHDARAKEPRVAHRLAAGLVDWNKQVINI